MRLRLIIVRVGKYNYLNIFTAVQSELYIIADNIALTLGTMNIVFYRFCATTLGYMLLTC
jgi:hypothetical protein